VKISLLACLLACLLPACLPACLLFDPALFLHENSVAVRNLPAEQSPT